MFYFDTSFVAPLVLQEPTSEAVATFIGGLDSDELTISHWTTVEFASLIAREVRTGSLDAEAAHQAVLRFESMAEESFVVLLPSAADFVLARHYLGRFETGLRAGDALHLAIARNHGATAIYSLDRPMVKAGSLLSLPVTLGIEAVC